LRERSAWTTGETTGHPRARPYLPNGRWSPRGIVRRAPVRWKLFRARSRSDHRVVAISECCSACTGKTCKRYRYPSISKDLCGRTDRRWNMKNFGRPIWAEFPPWQTCKTSCFATAHHWAALILRRGHDNQEVLRFGLFEGVRPLERKCYMRNCVRRGFFQRDVGGAAKVSFCPTTSALQFSADQRPLASGTRREIFARHVRSR